MDYTKFHIGLYTTLCTLLVGVMSLADLKERTMLMFPYFLCTLVCFAIAGVFGGLIGSSLPHYANWDEFRKAKLGPFFLPNMIPSDWVAGLEHAAFWIGTISALWGVSKAYLAVMPG